jgi:hypothetical protein
VQHTLVSELLELGLDGCHTQLMPRVARERNHAREHMLRTRIERNAQVND